MAKRYVKDPDATLDFAIDWSEWLDGDVIATSVWVLSAGLTEVSSSNDDTISTVWLSGGTAGDKEYATNRITTGTGRIDDRTIVLAIAEK